MNKKFLFAIMAIAAGLVFGSCASEEEQTEEVVEEIDTVAVDTVAVEEPVVEEPVAPAPKKAKKETVKEEPAQEAPKAAKFDKKVQSNEPLKAADAPQTMVNGKPVRKINPAKTNEEGALKTSAPIKK